MTTVDVQPLSDWATVCPLDRLLPDRGAAALVDGVQVAVFILSATGTVHAVGNLDPFSRAQVISRGVVGDRDGEPVVVSPMYKQRFSLRTGRCVEQPAVALELWDARIEDGVVQVRRPS